MSDAFSSAHGAAAVSAFFLHFPRPVRFAVAGLVVVLGLLGVATRISTLDDVNLTRNDFTQDYVSARAWANGDDPYAPTAGLGPRFLGPDAASLRTVYAERRNPHTPAELTLVRPFSMLKYRIARVAWLVFTALCLALGVGMFARALGWNPGIASVAGIGALAVPIAQKDLLYGQLNGPLLLLLVIGWRSMRQGNEVRAGMTLGIAAALKLFPAFLVLPLIRAGRTRALGWFAATALAVSTTCAAAVGLEAARRFLTEAAPANFRFWRAAPMNLSLAAMPFRWLARSIWRPDAPDLEALAAVLAFGLMAVCVIGAVRTPARLTGDPFWAAVAWMLLAIPLSWEFSLVLMFPAMLLVFATGPVPSPIVLPAAGLVLIGIPPGLATPMPGNSIAVTVLGYGLPAYALVLLTLAEWRRRPGLADAAV